MLKTLLYRLQAARLSRALSYSVDHTPLTEGSDIPPDMGDADSRPVGNL